MKAAVATQKHFTRAKCSGASDGLERDPGFTLPKQKQWPQGCILIKSPHRNTLRVTCVGRQRWPPNRCPMAAAAAAQKHVTPSSISRASGSRRGPPMTETVATQKHFTRVKCSGRQRRPVRGIPYLYPQSGSSGCRAASRESERAETIFARGSVLGVSIGRQRDPKLIPQNGSSGPRAASCEVPAQKHCGVSMCHCA